MSNNTNFNSPNSNSNMNLMPWLIQEPAKKTNAPATGQPPAATPPPSAPPPSTGPVPLDDNLVWQDVITQAQSYTGPAAPNTVVPKDSFMAPYVTYSNHPSLPGSTVNDPALAKQALQMLSNPSQDIMNKVFGNLVKINTTPVFVEDTSQYADKPVTNQDIIQLAQKNGVSPGVLQHNIQEDQQRLIGEQLKKLYPNQADKIIFALNNPGEVAKLPPDLQAKLQGIQENVRQQLVSLYKLPMTFGVFEKLPIDISNFQMQFSIEAENAFSHEISDMIIRGTITPEEGRALMAMQGGLTEGTPHLKLMLQNIKTNVLFQLQNKYGFDSGFEIKPDVSFYNNVVNGDFAQTYQKNIAKYTGAATAEQKELLKQYAANPKDPSIPDSIKQLAQQIESEKKLLLQAFPDPGKSSLPDNLKAAAKEILEASRLSVIEAYGLDTAWQPTITALVALGVDSKTLQLANNALAMARGVVEEAENLVKSMPDIPEKGQFLSYLKAIGEALNRLQNSIYAMQASESNMSKIMSTAKMTSELDNLAKQQRACEKAKKAASKMASLGPLGKIFEWLIKIILLVLSVFAGPVGVALAMFYIVDSAITDISGKKTSLTQQMFQEIAKSVHPSLAAFFKFLISAAIMMVMCNPFLGMHILLGDSEFMQSVIASAGGDKTAQALGAMIFKIVIEIAVMVVLLVVTGGAAAPGMAAAVAEQMAKTFQIAAEIAEKIVRISQITMNVIISSLMITQQAVVLNNNILLAKIDIIKGEAEAYSEEIEALIKLMQKIIDLLLGLIKGYSDQIVSINKFQGAKWTDASQLTSQIAG